MEIKQQNEMEGLMMGLDLGLTEVYGSFFEGRWNGWYKKKDHNQYVADSVTTWFSSLHIDSDSVVISRFLKKK